MAADAIPLYLDISTPQGALVRGLSDRTPFTLGPFYQGQLLKLRIFPVIPTGNRSLTPYFAKVSLTNLDVQVVVGIAAGAESIKAAQYTWTKQTTPDSDGESGYFYADLNLNTSEMNTAIGSSATYSPTLEILMSRAGASFAAVHQADITIKAVVKDPAGAASIPTPSASYLTAAECYNLFVLWDNRIRAANAGRNLVFVSPDSAHTRELGVDNDGSPLDNPS